MSKQSKEVEKSFKVLEKYARQQERDIEIPDSLPCIPLRNGLGVFPNTVVPFYVGREKSLIALEEAMENTIDFSLLSTRSIRPLKIQALKTSTELERSSRFFR